ncbi:uncharacterized protein METZ01_LOCUS375781 [marine metagenome]|uniref:Uncharacterized protein n=1 Tax=marine metagenome TaxID=408172 RepID=A0A382TN29_9ZZZZ
MRTRYQYVESGETLIQITYGNTEDFESTFDDEEIDGWWWIPYFSLEDVLPECERVGY